MGYRFYIDTYFITSFLVDLIVFLGAKSLLKSSGKWKRVLLLSGVMAGVETVLFLLMPSYILYRVLVLFVVNPLIVLGLFYPHGKQYLFKGYVTITGLFLFVGGLQMLFSSWITMKDGNGIWMAMLATVAVALCIYQHKLGMNRQHICEVEIRMGTESVFLKAYHDTGNFLRDVYTGKPVSIVDSTIANLLSVPVEGIRYIPFHSVGTTQGVMQIFTVDALVIYQEQKEQIIEQAVIGLSEKKLFLKQDFHMLLHSELL